MGERDAVPRRFPPPRLAREKTRAGLRGGGRRVGGVTGGYGGAGPAHAAALTGTRGHKGAFFVLRIVSEQRLRVTQQPLNTLQRPPGSSRRGTGGYTRTPLPRGLFSRGSRDVRGATGRKCSFEPSSHSWARLRQKNACRGGDAHRPENLSSAHPLASL